MVEVLKLSIKSFCGLKNVDLEISKTILYGLNGSGKSRSIYALAYMLNPKLLPEYLEIHDINIDIEFIGRKIGLHGNKWTYYEMYGSKEVLSEFFKPIDVYTLLRSDGAVLKGRLSKDVMLDMSHLYTISKILQDPEVVEDLEAILPCYTSIKRLYWNRAKVGNTWVDVNSLSFGERKTIIIQYLIKYSDLVMIENYDSGLHLCLSISLLNWIYENSKYVILETHNPLVLRRAVEMGWKCYYFNGKNVIEVTKDNVNDLTIFKPELDCIT